MNESQRKWLLDLHEKGFRFNEYHDDLAVWMENSELLDFTRDLDCYRIPAQSIPDIPDWRELCREMQSKGVEFEAVCGDGSWKKSRPYFFPDFMGKEDYRIPQQPITKWREEMTEEAEPDPREEIPHRELQIQWHEDMLHHLRTGEPMRAWEVNYEDEGYWKPLVPSNVSWSDCHKYRRKPRTVTYWHCVCIYKDALGDVHNESFADTNKDIIECRIKTFCSDFKNTKFGPIIETTVEVDD